MPAAPAPPVGRGQADHRPPRPRLIWAAAGLEVRVNPELRLDVDGRPLVTKLHFKADELDENRRDNILCLLAETAPPGTEAAILDARRGELLTAEEIHPDLDALLVSEAAAFMTLLAASEEHGQPQGPPVTQSADLLRAAWAANDRRSGARVDPAAELRRRR